VEEEAMLQGWLHYLLSFTWWKHPTQIAVLALVAWIVHRYVLSWLRKLTARTQTKVDDLIIDLLDSALKPVLFLAVLAAALNMLPLSPKFLDVANRTLYLLALAVVLYYGTRLLQIILEQWMQRADAQPSLREPLRFVTRALFGVLAIMIVLDNLGVSLTALWTTLGVGSVAIALALQETLANFFAGFYLQLDRPIRIGDYIKFEGGHEGTVQQMSWRSTRIRTVPNNTIIVPNSAVITNYSLPEPRLALWIPIGVSYSADPEQVERVLLEEAMAAAESVPGLVSDPAPFVRFMPGFGDSSLNFTLICRITTYVDQYLVQHELRKRIFTRFRKESIQIPFPQRDVHFFAEHSNTPVKVVVQQEGGAPKP
jgi:small-conductance mechanosensitive channel